MLYGHVRDHMPRVLLSLPGIPGPLNVEFCLDTGFEGELALPSALAANLQLEDIVKQTISMADGTIRTAFVGYIMLEWNEEQRPTEVLVLDGNPLMGMLLLEGSHVHIEATDGGEVVIEPL
jgi:clan AA aspartic protease